jgi:hypothetical protein
MPGDCQGRIQYGSLTLLGLLFRTARQRCAAKEALLHQRGLRVVEALPSWASV